MPKLTVEGYGTFDVPKSKRLVLALVMQKSSNLWRQEKGN